MVDKSTDGPKPAAPPPAAGGDVAYAMGDPAKFAAKEAARTLYNAGASYEQTEMQKLLRQQAEAQLNSAKVALISDIEAALAATPEGDAKKELRELKERVGGARSVGELTTLRTEVTAAATAAASAAAAKAETPQEKVDRLWGEIKKLNEEAKKEFDKLPVSKEREEECKELEEAVRKAEKSGNAKELIEAQRKLIEFYKKTGAQYEPDGPLVKKALEMEKALEEYVKQQEIILKKLEEKLPDSHKSVVREKFERDRLLLKEGALSADEINRETKQLMHETTIDRNKYESNAQTAVSTNVIVSSNSISAEAPATSITKLDVAAAEAGQHVTPAQTPEQAKQKLAARLQSSRDTFG